MSFSRRRLLSLFGRSSQTTLCVLAALSCLLPSCKAPQGETPHEKRTFIREMRDETLAELYELDPAAEDAVDGGAGYAVFSCTSSKILALASGNGFGIAVGEDGDETFLQMMEIGIGIGIGIKHFKAVFVFQNEQVFDDFLAEGWDFGGDADASAEHEGEGEGVGAQASVFPGVRIYQLTDTGIALSATLSGTKYWPDDELN